MNEEEKAYLPQLQAALEASGYPADAVQLILQSGYATHIIGDAWRNHVEVELSKGWFERRWLAGPMRCYWMWQPNIELEKLPQDVSRRAEDTMKRREKPVEAESAVPIEQSVPRTRFKKSSR